MILLLFVALATASTPLDYSHFRMTNAEERQITSAEYQRCMGRSLHNEKAVKCIRKEWDNLDRRLNAGYGAALAKMQTDRARQQLRAAQRRWLRERYEECSLENTGGHTPYELALHQCEIDELTRRVAWLRHLAAR